MEPPVASASRPGSRTLSTVGRCLHRLPTLEVSIVMGVPLYRWMVYFMENPMKIGWELEVPPLDIQDDKTACRAEKMGRPQDRKAGSLNMPSNCRSCLKLFHTSTRLLKGLWCQQVALQPMANYLVVFWYILILYDIICIHVEKDWDRFILIEMTHQPLSHFNLFSRFPIDFPWISL